jgi:hypothetical protein
LPPGDGRSRREERRGRLKKGERNARVSLRMRMRGTFAAFCSTGCGYRWSQNSNNPFLICAQGRVCRTCWRKSHLAPRLITETAYTAGWSNRKSIVKCYICWLELVVALSNFYVCILHSRPVNYRDLES